MLEDMDSMCCVLEAVKDVLCLPEVPKVMRGMLLYMLEAVDRVRYVLELQVMHHVL